MKRIIPFLILLVATPAAACDHFVRAYNAEATVPFCLWETDGTDLKTDAVLTDGEVKVSQNEAAEANCTNNSGMSSNICVKDTGSCYALVLDAGEMDTGRVTVNLIDTAAKTFLDKCIVIDTFGNASAQFPTADVNVTSVTDGALANADLAADFLSAAKVNADVSTEFATTLLATTTTELASMPSAATPTVGQQLRWLYQYGLGIYKITSTSTTQTLKKDDGTTSLGTCAISDDGTTFSKNECN